VIARLILAALLVVVGATIVGRMLAFGLHPEILPGIVLGTAMIALGVHRLSLILHVMRAR
jgi:hypothetical protein